MSGTDSSTIRLLGDSEVTSLQYHPQIENFFITSDSGEGVRLWDARMAWTGEPKKGVVQKVSTFISRCASFESLPQYNTRLCRKNLTHTLADPEASSVVFDRDGNIGYLYYVSY